MISRENCQIGTKFGGRVSGELDKPNRTMYDDDDDDDGDDDDDDEYGPMLVMLLEML